MRRRLGRPQAWVAENYRLEYISELGPTNAIHVSARQRSRVGGEPFALVPRVRRILDSAHIGRWAGQWTWLQPVHEGVKRIGDPRQGRWVRAFLAWRGLPCMCNHIGIVEHLADRDEVDAEMVWGAVLAGLYDAYRAIGLRSEQGFIDERRTTYFSGEELVSFAPTPRFDVSVWRHPTGAAIVTPRRQGRLTAS